MSADPYSKRVRDLFATTPHAGTVDGGVRMQLSEQDVRIELSAGLVGTRLDTLRFRARGCPHTIAAAEAFCETCEGTDAADLGTFDVRQLMQTLAVPTEKTGRILVLEDAIRSLGTAVRESLEPP